MPAGAGMLAGVEAGAGMLAGAMVEAGAGDILVTVITLDMAIVTLDMAMDITVIILSPTVTPAEAHCYTMII